MPDFITTGRIKSMNQQQYTPSQTKTDRIASMLGPVNTTVTTSTGKQYTLDDKQVGWIQNRYKSKMADTYGYDDADQLAKRNGQLSAAALKTYKNTNVDRQLAELGLPSEKELGKYLEDYSRWHTGGMDQVFGQMNLPKDYWTKTKGFYQADMQKAYENTAEDQQRKARGLMPSKWEEKYTDTEIDEQLRARGLPPRSEFGTYAERWNNYQGIENFYANVARNETNLRLAGIKDDDTVYPYNGEEYKGKDLYAMAFYDELDKVNDDGSFVYGSIRPLFKNSSSKEPTLTGDYLYDRGAAVLADNKNAVSADDYASYNAFSYDDYKSKYPELYERYFANQQTTNGQTVSDALAVQARDADEEATKQYYDVDNSWFGETKKGIKQLVEQYQQEYPQNTFYDMFSDMLKNNVSLTNVRKAAKALQGETKTNGAFNAISEALVKAENDWAHTEELDAMYGANGYDVVEGRVIPKGATPVEGEAAPEPTADTKTFFNFGDAYANAAKGYDTSAEAARAEQKALRNQQRVANRTLASEQVDEDLLKQTKDAIAIYDSAVAAYEDTAGNGAPSAASREPINKANELLNQLGYKSIYGARRYVESFENGEQESEQLKKDVTDAIKELDDAKADASLKGDEKSLQAVVDAEKKVTSLLDVGSADEAREWLRTGELPASEATFNGTAVTVDNAIKVVETYMEQNGGWNAKVAQQAFNELYRIGVSPDIIAQTAAEMQDRFGEMEETFTEPEKPDAPGIDSMREYVEANKDRGTDEATVNDTKKALERLLFDEEGNNIVLTNADSVINAIETVRNMPFTTPAAVDLALKDLGFSTNGWFSGVAEDLTNGWSTDEMVNLRLALGRERAVDVDPEDNLPDDAKFVRDTFGLSDFWMGDPVSSSQKILRQDDFALALEWANQQIANGTLSAGQAYNILAEDGYHDELEILMGDDWHKAHFKEYVAPGLWNMSKEEDRLLWDEMSEAERDAATELMWERLSDEDKEAKYGDPSWWKYDPSVKRTAKQAWGQQAAAILPGLISQLISTPVTIADSVDALITGRPETWGFTDKLNNIQNAVSSYGSVDEFSLGTRSAEWITSAAQELLKMETLGSVGNLAGEIFSGTGVGSKIIKSAASNSKVVSKAASFVMEMIKASPYVAESYADHYIDAKLRGATNGEAAFYGLTLGGAEGAFEWANFDKLWGKALGSDKFVKEIIQGGLDYANMGINGKLLLSSLALSFAGEATEEFAGYNLETLEKLALFSGNGLGEKLGLTPWANGTEYSLREGLEQAFVGGLIGLLGAGLHSGSLTTRHLIMDYAIDNGDAETFRKVAPDIAYSIGIAESLSKSDLDMYKQGGANIMSSTAYGETLTQIANLDEGIENAGKALEDELSKLQLKRETQLREIDKKAAKGFAVDLDKANPKEALDVLTKKCNELGVDIHDIDLAKFIRGGMTEQESEATKALLSQRSQEAVQRNKAAVQKDYDAAVACEQGKYQAAVKQNQNLLDGLTKQVQGHWVGIYLQNYNGIISGMTDEMVSNLAQAYQNGAKYEPGQAAEQQAAKQSKLAEAEANETIEEATEEEPENAGVKARELAYDRVYKDHEAGKAYAEEGGKSDSKLTPVEFAENERQNFQAKTTARLRRVTLELTGLEAKEGMTAKEIFEEAKKAMTPEAAQKLDMYQKLSKALGLNMVVRDVVAGTSGYVHDGKLYVTLNGKQSMLRVASHELTHYMKGHASEQYDALRTHLVNEVGQERFDQMLAEKAQEYGLDFNDAKARLEADDEVCAELCERMLENQDALERFVQSDLDAAKTLKARLGKTLVAIKSAIRSLGTSDAQTKADYIKEQETIETWYKGLSDAIDNANRAKGRATTETATVTEVTTDAPQAPPVETNPDLYMGDESARREQLRTDLEALAKKGTKVNGLSYQEVNDVLDRVILGDKSNYSKADYAQIRGMLAQLIPEVQAMVNGDESVDVDALNERVSAALDYMLERYSEGSEDYYGLRDLIPNKIALTEAAYNELRSRDMTLREASNELRNALGGKFVNFVYKKSPGYNNAMSIDELWTRIADAYGEPDGYGNIQEDALALIDYAKDRNTRTSFDDLYGSQREDVVNAQVGEFLDAVQSMAEGKAAETAALHKIDDDYMGLVKQYEDGDRKAERQLENDISEAAKISGYTTPMLFHGTPKFGWTTYQDSRHDTPFIYTSTKPEVAAHYAGDQNYAFRRDIGKKYDGGDSLESIIEDARWVYETHFQKPTEQSKIARYASDIDTASKIADRIDYLWGKVDYDTRTFPEEMDNIIHGMADIFYTIRDGDVAYGKTADEAARFLASDVEAQKELSENIAWSLRYLDRSREAFRNYYGEHRDEMSRDEKALFSYLMSYEVGDAAIDIEYGLALLLNNDRVLQRVADGGFVSADELRKGMDASHNIGAYKLYGDLGDNPFVFDANGGQFWALKVPEVSDGYTDTDAVSRWALANGYTSVVMKNIYDYGDKADNYVFFSPSQIKSADPVTYDDDGNVIPPSERFTRSENDIRWTVDNDLNDLVNQYGAIEQGREPRARDVQVPRQSADNMRTSKLTRSLEESSKVTNEQAAEIQSEIGSEADRVKQLWSYIPKSNDETMQKAKEFIAARQPATAQREFHDMVVGGKYGTRTAAIGLQLLSDASARDDWASVKDIAYDLRVLATEAGQSAQIFNVLKDLKGVGSAWYVEKLVNNLNTMYADEIQSGQMDPITVSEAAMNQVRAAKTQVEVDAAERLVADEIGPQLPLKLDEKLSNWRYLSMLGNPVTHIRNVTGNNLMHLMGGMKDVVASGVQRVLESAGVTDESDRAHARLTSADKSYWDDFAQKSYDEQKRNLQGGGKLGFQSLVQQSKRSFDNKVLDTIARGKDPGTMSERKGLVGLLQNIRNNGAMGMLEVEDAWGLEKNYKRSLMEYMKAQGYSLNNEGQVGKVGKDGSFTEITNEQMNKAIEWATNQAWTNTFRGPSQLATELNKISKMNTASKLIVEGVMPFKKTPINIAKQGAMYSPAGIVVGTAELLTKVKQGKMSAATAIDHLSSGLTGTALMALGVVLAKAGILRGGGEDKKKLETYLEDTGDQTYAFKFGNVSVNMSAIAPATIPLFMGVALQEMLSRNGEDDGVDLSTITDVLAGTLNPFMEMSFMSSLNSALKNYNNEGIGGALGSTIMTAAQNYGSQYLPTLGGKVAQFIDPTQRTTKSSATSPVGGNMDYYWRSLVKKVPGAEATLQPDVNIWGQTTTKDSFGDWALDFANKFILPTNVKIANRDAVDNELIRVVESTGVADFLPSDGAKYFKVKGETYKMNASQYTQYSKERGQAAYAALKDVMASASYKNATDEQKADLLKKALDNAYKAVNNVWKEKLGAFD